MAQGIDPDGLDPVGRWIVGWLVDFLPYLALLIAVALILWFVKSKLED